MALNLINIILIRLSQPLIECNYNSSIDLFYINLITPIITEI